MVKSEQEFDYIKIKLASPIRILQWSNRRLPNNQFTGEVQTAETINYRTFKPEMDGLFCERIFGPSKSFECSCGKYKRIRFAGLICERCGVELIESRVRRHRMGYINLIYPVTHVWYIHSRPNYLAILLEVEQSEKRLDTSLPILWLNPITLIFKKKFLYHEKIIPKNLKIVIQKFQKKYNIGFQSKENILYDLKKPEKFQIFEKYFNESQKAYYKPKKAKMIDLWDNRIKRIKLASLIYFIADDEISFYGLHWDLQQYRRSREVGISGYSLKPHYNPKDFNKRYNLPKYLLQATPNFLVGSTLIKYELEQLNINREIRKTRSFITISTKILNKENPIYQTSLWTRKWEYKRIYKLRNIAIQRIRILENLNATKSSPSWMIISVLPVIPPALRPMIQLEGGRFATSDLNELYRRIITRNNRLLRLLEIDAPQLIIRNEKRMLQEAVDSLIDNGKRGKIALSTNNRPLKSLSDIIKGKYGRFRQNLLGKRVDYSGRSVIVVGPSLKLNQCGLPYEMAIELFQPFIIHKLIKQGLASTMKTAKNLIQKRQLLVNVLLKKILCHHPIFLNRAPTLHRLGIQAFEPILIKGKAIKLHPLVCSAFNADFDGDQMAIHIPLSLEAQTECYMLLLAPYNFLSPANGEPIILPSQDMVLGCYYLTLDNIPQLLGANHYFKDFDDVILAYNHQQIDLHSLIWVRYLKLFEKLSPLIKKVVLNDGSYIEYYKYQQIRKSKNGNTIVQYIQTTAGRVIFNYVIQKTLQI